MILETDNPYVTPESDVQHNYSETEGFWRRKKLLIMDRDSTLPDRCVKCNAPADGFQVKKDLYYYSTTLTVVSLVLFFIIGILIIIPLLIFRKHVKIKVGLCERHRKRRRNLLWMSGGFLVLTVAAFLVSSLVDNAIIDFAIPFAIGGFSFLLCLFFLAAANISLFAKKIDDQHLWIKGINADFLQKFPELPE